MRMIIHSKAFVFHPGGNSSVAGIGASQAVFIQGSCSLEAGAATAGSRRWACRMAGRPEACPRTRQAIREVIDYGLSRAVLGVFARVLLDACARGARARGIDGGCSPEIHPAPTLTIPRG